MSSESQAISKSDPVEMPFEQALGRLESIVELMEADDLPLEDLLARFEEGTRLYQACQTRLSEAELKIQQLERTASGDPVLKPFSVENSARE